MAEEVRTYIGRVRQRLAEVDAPCRIETARRRGYTLVFDVKAST